MIFLGVYSSFALITPIATERPLAAASNTTLKPDIAVDGQTPAQAAGLAPKGWEGV